MTSGAYMVQPVNARERRRLRGSPKHYHLLGDEDLGQMRGIFEAIRDRRDEVVNRWYLLYMSYFGEARTFSEGEFSRIFEPALLRNKNDLLENNMERYATDVRGLGALLAGREIPLQELITSFELFQQAARTVFPRELPNSINIQAKFEQLNHIRLYLLMDSYLHACVTTSGTRVNELEPETGGPSHHERSGFRGLVGRSSVMLALYQRIDAASHTRGTILIIGETGTGKELVARALHENGAKPPTPFIALNCAALPKDLIESELFGYKRGAFSGANAEYLGLFRAAEGGTLFLDEITEMNADTQSKLLRAIQEHAVRPVGSTQEVTVNVRLVASTNRDPEEALRSQVLRQDLYYRLQANLLHVPPLRERVEDVPALVAYFIAFFNDRLGKLTVTEGIEEAALDRMCEHRWPGNVRELANAIESAMTFGIGPLIRLQDLPSSVTLIDQRRSAAVPAPPSNETASFAEVERNLIFRTLHTNEWNKAHAARMLKISRKRLYAKIEKYQLEQCRLVRTTA
jgi:transcriptional regulator with PAS, ATPase and Fis domain